MQIETERKHRFKYKIYMSIEIYQQIYYAYKLSCYICCFSDVVVAVPDLEQDCDAQAIQNVPRTCIPTYLQL